MNEPTWTTLTATGGKCDDCGEEGWTVPYFGDPPVVLHAPRLCWPCCQKRDEAKRPPPAIEEVGGSDPDFTGGVESSEYVRRQREDE